MEHLLKAAFECNAVQKEVMRVENFIKKQKRRKLLQQLCEVTFIPSGALAQLVRVPDLLDPAAGAKLSFPVY